MIFGWFKKRRRQKILAQPVPESWALHLNRNVRLSWNLPPAEMKRLQKLTQVFVAEKHWEGCEGLEVTEEMKVTIAAQACLMLLGVEGFYFDNVRTILVYPRTIVRASTKVGERCWIITAPPTRPSSLRCHQRRFLNSRMNCVMNIRSCFGC